jgi:protein-arginine kinase activator protein McsA
LRLAVAEESYEEAARLRDQIHELEGRPTPETSE